MINPTEADIGRTVRYTPIGHAPGLTGEIARFKGSFIWVQFGNRDIGPMPILRGHLSWEPQND